MEDKSRKHFSGYQSIPARENFLLAHYAIRSENTSGRKYAEPIQVYRGPYQRDRDRIIHTAAYRRLSHKTQVFTNEFGDYHRNRLTHTLEVCSIA
ncbi:MAG: metal-dependent phosphohydrolase, partial [Planctomycetota bacterium]|nr:metal-dependent phosphohydrolase [Planctomycetota bacterium]